ncbi:hypothetical protein GOL78_15050 [Sinorhizobium medicae]|nr:hypothetical protein [Sinorhizobium medicae]MDX1210823.1 hypothetical protein [Sinorhizobium medicae]
MSIHNVAESIKRNAGSLAFAMRCDPTDAGAQAALKEFIARTYSDLASLAWHLGADGDVFQREAVPASELVDDAYFAINREKEFEAPVRGRVYSTLNHPQQFGSGF